MNKIFLSFLIKILINKFVCVCFKECLLLIYKDFVGYVDECIVCFDDFVYVLIGSLFILDC